jgi:Type II inositol 1,4,5-trisphosphate 5-phosphatase PH domain
VVGAEHQNRILAIVRSGSSSALFAFNVSTYPPVNLSDLQIDSIAPINESFLIDSSCGYGISSHQFQILTGSEQILYYYYPDEETCRSKANLERVLKKLIQGE